METSTRDEENKDYKDKGKISCYIAKEETKDGFDDNHDEVVYSVMEDESDEAEASTLVSCVNTNDRCIIIIIFRQKWQATVIFY